MVYRFIQPGVKSRGGDMITISNCCKECCKAHGTTRQSVQYAGDFIFHLEIFMEQSRLGFLRGALTVEFLGSLESSA